MGTILDIQCPFQWSCIMGAMLHIQYPFQGLLMIGYGSKITNTVTFWQLYNHKIGEQEVPFW